MAPVIPNVATTAPACAYDPVNVEMRMTVASASMASGSRATRAALVNCHAPGRRSTRTYAVAISTTLLGMRENAGVPTSTSSLMESDPLLSLAWQAASAAGSFLQHQRPRDLQVSTKSTATDAVTEMDKAAEGMIVSHLLAYRPTDGVLGEEGGERTGSSDVRWIVDPLDGTVNYIYGLPAWGVSVAAERDGRTVVGVVLAPEFDVAWCAVKGRGAWEISGDVVTGIEPTSVTSLEKSLIATGFGYEAGRRGRQGEVVAGLLPHVRDIRRVGAAVIDLCWVASGHCDGYFERGLHPWDFAAGALIAHEAGAKVSAMADQNFSEGIVVSAPGIATQLHERLLMLNAHLV